MIFTSNAKANLSYFYNYHQENIKKLHFYPKTSLQNHKINKIATSKRQTIQFLIIFR